VRCRPLKIRTCLTVGAILACATQLGIGSPGAVASAGPDRCSVLPAAPPTHNGWQPAKRALAPSGPSEIRLCRYAFRNNPRGTNGDQLVGHGLATRAKAAELVGSFDALRTEHGQRFQSCSFDPAPVVAYLEYPDGHSVTIFVVTNNCWSATNGEIARSAGESSWLRLRKRLWRLTRG
jgi:hypothetical protein